MTAHRGFASLEYIIPPPLQESQHCRGYAMSPFFKRKETRILKSPQAGGEPNVQSYQFIDYNLELNDDELF